ncbi:MAG: lysylphosphatidylglycerol synthase domain-containing protein [Pseudorhizobium sp.]
MFPERRKRASLRLVLGLLLSSILLGWLLTSFSVIHAPVWILLARHPWAIGSIAFGSVFLMTALSAAKWQMLLKLAAPDLAQSVKFDQFFAYTAASSALGQIVPPYIAGPAVRGAVMKSQHNADFARSAMLAAYEQLFDVVALMIGGMAALALLLGGIIGPAGVACFVGIVALTPAALYMLPDRCRLMKIAAILPTRWSVTRRIRMSVETGSAAGLDAPRLLGHLTVLSSLRYAILVMRTLGIGLILLPAVPWETLALGFAAVQLSSLATLTPGNLGITELSWSAMTVFTDRATMGEFVAFALVLRVSGLLATALLAALALVWLRLQ